MPRYATSLLASLSISLGLTTAAQAAPALQLGKTAMSGEQTYTTVCATCHRGGLLHSPKAGDAKAWKPLIAEGYDDLVGSALTGVRMMPPKGGVPELYDIEVARAVVYMVGLAGGKFPEPTEANVKAARLDGEKRHAARLKKAAASRQ